MWERILPGMGSGGIKFIVGTTISDLVPSRERGNYVAITLLVYTASITLGPWVGGLIVTNTSWRWVFLINAPVSLS
jgi:MFS family permease